VTPGTVRRPAHHPSIRCYGNDRVTKLHRPEPHRPELHPPELVVADLSAAALEALGDPNRRAILEVLARGSRPVGEIADELPISRPAVSRHLRLLKAAELVDDEPDGTRRVYRLRAEGVEAVYGYFESMWGEAFARYRLVAENRPENRRRARGRTR
jgi:DNA-binding transcriptional ArsR family regulator